MRIKSKVIGTSEVSRVGCNSDSWCCFSCSCRWNGSSAWRMICRRIGWHIMMVISVGRRRGFTRIGSRLRKRFSLSIQRRWQIVVREVGLRGWKSNGLTDSWWRKSLRDWSLGSYSCCCCFHEREREKKMKNLLQQKGCQVSWMKGKNELINFCRLFLL